MKEKNHTQIHSLIYVNMCVYVRIRRATTKQWKRNGLIVEHIWAQWLKTEEFRGLKKTNVCYCYSENLNLTGKILSRSRF